ncbi:hypothetical protein EZV73_11840 [Acidaminobacter sp. JC074]|uniref:nitrilase-related carbon-nitrogen hydrolase n=1 Tax=Acidaminobacter sp. JC074 TaxID=2530199 RepID=UPI001F0F533C|nr:nitrilase-related carbon-nitrogen hydrolase [Acidaminobacter sp. JC074]MCH4888271.1 hypothetical protein [Acidaminobacter sp. JC074]
MKLGLVQFKQCMDINDNLSNILQLQEDVDVLVFPESALTGYRSDCDNSITLDHSSIRALQEKNMHYLLGANIDGHISYLHISDQIDLYHKSHLGLKEKKLFKPGNELKVFDVKGVKVGVALCIESHIPDISQTLRLMGAEVIIMPFASPHVCGDRYDLWSKYLPARAYDNSVYVIALNLTGDKFSGGILAYDYLGNEILGHFDRVPCTRVLEIDIDALRERRKKHKVNYINRRRPELYRKDDHELY